MDNINQAANLPKLILASASPRRRELIARLGRPYACETSQAEEIIPPDLPLRESAEYLAGLKAESVFRLHGHENVTVVGSDTIVYVDGHIYGKPGSKEEAFSMLKTLSGRIHEVLTGVAVISSSCGAPGTGAAATGFKISANAGTGQDNFINFSFTDISKVEFWELDDDEIRAYIATGEPFDKAGAYGVQGMGSLLIKAVYGDFYTVMGLPVSRLNRELKAHGV